MSTNILHRAIVLAGILEVLSDEEAFELGKKLDIVKIEQAITADSVAVRDKYAARSDQVELVTELAKEFFPEAVRT